MLMTTVSPKPAKSRTKYSVGSLRDSLPCLARSAITSWLSDARFGVVGSFWEPGAVRAGARAVHAARTSSTVSALA
eukprot:383286-Prymnesium_polylepis.1